MSYEYLTDGNEIYARSFAMIRDEADLSRFPADISTVAVRMIHASGQVDLAPDIDYSPTVVCAARAALEQGAPVLCDVNMVARGIIGRRLPAGNDVVCSLGDPTLPALAQQWNTTRTAAAVELWGERIQGSVVAIGNAPTALFHLLEHIERTGHTPAAIIGCPVGFIGAAESKEALRENPFGVPYLVVRGRRGGSAITVAAVNAIGNPSEAMI